MGIDVAACLLLVGGIVALSAGHVGVGAAAGFSGLGAAFAALVQRTRRTG